MIHVSVSQLVTRVGGAADLQSTPGDLIPPMRELHHTFKWTRPLNH